MLYFKDAGVDCMIVSHLESEFCFSFYPSKQTFLINKMEIQEHQGDNENSSCKAIFKKTLQKQMPL